LSNGSLVQCTQAETDHCKPLEQQQQVSLSSGRAAGKTSTNGGPRKTQTLASRKGSIASTPSGSPPTCERGETIIQFLPSPTIAQERLEVGECPCIPGRWARAAGDKMVVYSAWALGPGPWGLDCGEFGAQGELIKLIADTVCRTRKAQKAGSTPSTPSPSPPRPPLPPPSSSAAAFRFPSFFIHRMPWSPSVSVRVSVDFGIRQKRSEWCGETPRWEERGRVSHETHMGSSVGPHYWAMACGDRLWGWWMNKSSFTLR
jgi:hypothetical protein